MNTAQKNHIKHWDMQQMAKRNGFFKIASQCSKAIKEIKAAMPLSEIKEVEKYLNKNQI